MKYLLAQPANLRFQWELDVFLTNLALLGSDVPIVLLFTEEYMPVVQHFRSRYPSAEIHSYPDNRLIKNYTPTIRPYLFWKYLEEDPAREAETYFQVDSDIVFRELIDFSNIPIRGNSCIVSDCAGYIGVDYILSCQSGEHIIKSFAEMAGITLEQAMQIPGGGAQWLIERPTAALWEKIFNLSQRMYDFLGPINTNLQKWTAEMWGQLYALTSMGWTVEVSPELDFCRPTDPIEVWSKVKILHNAGVTPELSNKLFYKGAYIDKSPIGADFSWVSQDLAGKKYVEAIDMVVY